MWQGLVYDTFCKGKIGSLGNRTIAAVTAVSMEKGDQILLKEWATRGSQPGMMGEIGTVFQLDTATGQVTLKTRGRLSR